MADRCGIAWLDALAAVLASDAGAMLVVVASAQGSTPRETGAAMVVSRAHCFGTIGGGHLEFDAIRVAREGLADDALFGTWIVRYPLAARVGQCCGGVATLAFSKVDRAGRHWMEQAVACARTAAPFAIISRVAPTRDAMRVVVTADDVRGTLGGVDVDSGVIALARARIARGDHGAALVRFENDDRSPLLIQVERADAFPVWLFGNGHVGRALVNVLGVVPAHLRWVDSRAADFPDTVPANVEIVVTDAPEDELEDAPTGAFVVVMTHSHALDLALVEAALVRDDWRYLGLIGSRSKRAQFERRLAARGASAEALSRLRCPIGAQGVGIRDKHPGSIAIAIAAEILMIREASLKRQDPSRTVELVGGH